MAEQLRLWAQTLAAAFKGTIASPTQDPLRTLLVASLVVIALLFIALLLLLLLEPRQRKVVRIRRYRLPESGSPTNTPEAEQTPEPVQGPEEMAEEPASAPERGRPRMSADIVRAVTRWAVGIAVVLAFVSGYAVTGSNAYCAETCHAGQEATDQATKADHASCVACHESPGVWAAPGNLVARTSMVLARFGIGHVRPALVGSDSCLRCHKTVLTQGASVEGVKMSHAEPSEAGITCTSCHAGAGHSSTRLSSMSPCIVCHDGKTASADCLTCHDTQPLASLPATGSVGEQSADATSVIGSGKVVYPLVEVTPGRCGACHDEKRQCDTCHGLRMPHAADFVDGGHAPVAAFEGKQLCWRCHQATDCAKCHSPFTAHGTAWKQSHQTYPWDSGCGCHNTLGRVSFCYVCHSSAAPHRLLR